MDSTKIGQFLAEVEKIERSGSRDSRSAAFAKRAYQQVVNVYETVFDSSWKKTGEYKTRKGANTGIADTLIEMGATEAVYGRGRALLHN